MIKYHITTFEFKGSIKDKLKDIDLPESAIPIGFETILKDTVIGNQFTESRFYSIINELQREWFDDAHTEFACVIDSKLKRYQVITRVYCLCPKAAGMPALDGTSNAPFQRNAGDRNHSGK
jgi:hypothetical protein